MFVEFNLEMKEENQMLKEQDIVNNEKLQKYEQRQEKMEQDVSQTYRYTCLIVS